MGDKELFLKMPPNETLGQGLKIEELCQDDITNTLVFFVNGEFENMFPSFLNITVAISAGLSSLGVPGVPHKGLKSPKRFTNLPKITT